MTRQRVAYDFEYFALDQPADAPVTVLSLGRSLLKDGVAVTLPLRPTAPLGQSVPRPGAGVPRAGAPVLCAVHLSGVCMHLTTWSACIRAASPACFTAPPPL